MTRIDYDREAALAAMKENVTKALEGKAQPAEPRLTLWREAIEATVLGAYAECLACDGHGVVWTTSEEMVTELMTSPETAAYIAAETAGGRLYTAGRIFQILFAAIPVPVKLYCHDCDGIPGRSPFHIAKLTIRDLSRCLSLKEDPHLVLGRDLADAATLLDRIRDFYPLCADCHEKRLSEYPAKR